MKNIIHIGLISHYTDGLLYQDQMLTEQHCHDQCSVLYISNCKKYDSGKLISVKPGIENLTCGAKLLRLKSTKTPNIPWRFALLFQHLNVLMICHEIKKQLVTQSPDVIFCHNPSPLLIVFICKYKVNNPNVKLYFDYHIDYHNAYRGNIFQKLYYLIMDKCHQLALKHDSKNIDKVFYIWGGTRRYLCDRYNIPESLLEFFPLGGKLPSKIKYTSLRHSRRRELGLTQTDILFIHSGKLLTPKKRTNEILEAFHSIKNPRFKLIIIGSIPDSQVNQLYSIIEKDSRIQYLGWKNGQELHEYFCAGDIYIQLGSASATMQNALCCGCPVLLNSQNGDYNEFMDGNGMFVHTKKELVDALIFISENPDIIEKMKDATWKIATELLDYRKLASRLYV